LSEKELEKTQDLSVPSAVAGSPALRAEQIPAGHRVGGYVIQSRIDAGGGGTVYIAEAADDPGRRVAIKVLLRELASIPLALSRFQREAEVVRLVDHPNIAGVLESGELPDGRPYIVMELVSTTNLRGLLEERGRLTPPELLEILEPVCSALGAAHAAGVIHRDLKASNISVGHEEGRLVVKLLDFGIAKMVQPEGSAAGLTVMGTRLGTPHAMAPEQIRGESVDERADIYALGVLIYHGLTGRYPFTAQTAPELERLHLTAPPPRPSAAAPVPATLDAVVLRCLEKTPAARYPSVAEVLGALRTAVAGAPAQAGPTEEAVALHVELAHAEGADEDEQAELMEEVEQALRQAGYQLSVSTGNLILGVRPVSGGSLTVRRQALELGRVLARRGLKVAVHLGSGSGLLRVGEWALAVERDGVRLTREAAADLD